MSLLDDENIVIENIPEGLLENNIDIFDYPAYLQAWFNILINTSPCDFKFLLKIFIEKYLPFEIIKTGNDIYEVVVNNNLKSTFIYNAIDFISNKNASVTTNEIEDFLIKNLGKTQFDFLIKNIFQKNYKLSYSRKFKYHTIDINSKYKNYFKVIKILISHRRTQFNNLNAI